MKVMVVMGSPRKRDGYRLSEKIREIMGKITAVEFEYIWLKDAGIKDCVGCDSCFRRGEEFCPVKDGFQEVVRKLEEADGVLFASPVYAQQVTAHIKRLADRGSYLFHRPRFTGKPAMILSTTASDGLKETLKYLRLIAIGWGFSFAGEIGIVSPKFFEDSARFNPGYAMKKMAEIEKKSLEFAHYLKNGTLPKPGLFAFAMFYAMRQKSLHFKPDGVYWNAKGWYDQPFYINIRLGLVRHLQIMLVKIIISLMMTPVNAPAIVN